MKLLTKRETDIMDAALTDYHPDDEIIVHAIGRLYTLYSHLARAIENSDLRGMCPFCRCLIGSIPAVEDHAGECVYRQVREAK